MSIRTHAVRGEEGVIFVQTALMILMLAAVSTLVIDSGVLWISRGQAQNAADAGALAGALARAYDDFGNPPAAGGRAHTAATEVAERNVVWTETPGTVVTWACPAGISSSCVRVDVHRDGTSGSTTLPAFFGPLIGVTTQRVRATATARVVTGNATNCMRPWAVADKWTHVVNPVPRYDRWSRMGGNAREATPHDIYARPDANGPGTGYTVSVDAGQALVLKRGNANSDTEAISPAWFLAIALPDGAGGYTQGAAPYRNSIGQCIGQSIRIGTLLPVQTGNMNGPTDQGFADLVAQDPSAIWNATDRLVDNSCAPGCAPMSPRIIPIPVFDMDEYQYRRAANDWSGCPGGGRCVRVVNVLGFFADRIQSGDITGYLMTYPGDFVPGVPIVGDNAGFMRSVQLVR